MQITKNAVVSIHYTLTDKSGTVINSRNGESETPAASIDILLSGDDLAIQAGESYLGERILTVEAVYNSTEGTNLPLKAEVHFIVDNLVNVS